MKTLAQLTEVNWNALEHAYGSAEDVPALLRALCDDDAQTRAHARGDLEAGLDHQGVHRGQATLEAIPFLIGLVADGRTPERGALLRLLAELALGDTWWFQHDGVHPEHQTAVDNCSRPKACSLIDAGEIHVRGFPSIGDNLDLSQGSLPRAIYDAVGAGVPTYAELATAEDADVRASVAYVLAWLTPQASRSAPALERLTEDPEASVRASAWLGLSHATKFDASLRERANERMRAAWPTVSDPLEKRALALGIVRREDGAFSAEVRPSLLAGIAEGLPPVIPDDAFPWRRIDATPFVFCTTFIGTPPAERGPVRAAALQGLPLLSDPHDAADLARWIIDLGIPREGNLDGPMLDILEQLCESPQAWYFQDTSKHLRDRGLPDQRDKLRTWLDQG